MVILNQMEKTVLMYLDSELGSRPEGMRASEMAETFGETLKDIIEVCEKLSKIDLLRIDHTYRAEGKVTDIKLHILSEGIGVYFENENPDIWG